MSARVRSVSAAFVALVFIASTASAQQPRAARALAAPNAELEEPWSGPLQVVELKNGNILIHDSQEKRLAVADFRTQEQRDVAREGSGPTEFRSSLGMWRTNGDSVHLLDLVQQRMLVLDPAGKAIATRPLPGAGDPMALMNQPMTRHLDARGRYYGQALAIAFEGGQMTMADSAEIVRSDPITKKADTLTRFPTFQKAPQFSPQVLRVEVPGYPSTDAWGVYPDGRVIVVRGNGYVPEFFPATRGPLRKGAALPYVRLQVTAADRKAMMDSVKKAMDDGIRQFGGGGPQMPRIELVEPAQWQTQRPPLTSDVIRIDPKGRAWVAVIDRTPGQRFDLLDANGAVVDAIKLAKDVILLGFGASGVYTALKDEDDLLTIRRHPLP
jgi:hypothetical protein